MYFSPRRQDVGRSIVRQTIKGTALAAAIAVMAVATEGDSSPLQGGARLVASFTAAVNANSPSYLAWHLDADKVAPPVGFFGGDASSFEYPPLLVSYSDPIQPKGYFDPSRYDPLGDVDPFASIAVPAQRGDLANKPKRHSSRRYSKPAVVHIQFNAPMLPPIAHSMFCLRYPSDCKVRKFVFRGGPIELTAQRRAQLVRINAEVNHAIIPQPNLEGLAGEKWLISPKAGDCNDYAVTKRHKLLALGWPERALLLSEVVTSWGEHHLVLVVRTREGDFVADNLNASIRSWSKTPYEWVRIQSPGNPTFWSAVANEAA